MYDITADIFSLITYIVVIISVGYVDTETISIYVLTNTTFKVNQRISPNCLSNHITYSYYHYIHNVTLQQLWHMTSVVDLFSSSTFIT